MRPMSIHALAFVALAACPSDPESGTSDATQRDTLAGDTAVAQDTTPRDTVTPHDTATPSDTVTPHDTMTAPDTAASLACVLGTGSLGTCKLGTCAGSCSGKQCGYDGCGVACGSCATGKACVEGKCVCQPDCGDAACGPDGCGGACGSCESNEACVDGRCECVPDCDGKSCGADGCGGVCGICSGQCVQGECSCSPSCAGKACGDDGCGGSCGACANGRVCDASTSQCVCTPHARTACSGGHVWSYDSCNVPEAKVQTCPYGCANGVCQSCTPSCQGQACGSDGCGGSCGVCPSGSSCQAGQCSCSNGTIRMRNSLPDSQWYCDAVGEWYDRPAWAFVSTWSKWVRGGSSFDVTYPMGTSYSFSSFCCWIDVCLGNLSCSGLPSPWAGQDWPCLCTEVHRAFTIDSCFEELELCP